MQPTLFIAAQATHRTPFLLLVHLANIQAHIWRSNGSNQRPQRSSSENTSCTLILMGPLECCCQPCFASCHSATARLGCCELVHGKPAPAEAHSPHMQRCNQRAAAQNSAQALMKACLPCSYQRNNSSAHQEGAAAAPTKTGAAAAAPTSICQDTRHMQHHMAQCRTHAHCLPSDWQASLPPTPQQAVHSRASC